MIKTANRDETVPVLLALQEKARKRKALMAELLALTGGEAALAHTRSPRAGSTTETRELELAYR